MGDNIKDELLKLNSKIDHVMKVVCELFIMLKSNEKVDDKIDICIKSLNTLSNKVDNIGKINTLNINQPLIPPPLMPPPLTPPLTQSYNSISTDPVCNNRNLFMDELKNKLKTRVIN